MNNFAENSTPLTVQACLRQGVARLKTGRGSVAARSNFPIETASLDASVLLAHILGCARAALIVNAGEAVSGEQARLYKAAIERRLDGECAAYITGKREFFWREFIVTKDVLVPRPETESLVETALRYIEERARGGQGIHAGNRDRGGHVDSVLRLLDLCTGSGCVPSSLYLELKNGAGAVLEVWASDISAEALAVARRNAANLGAAGIRFLQSDLFENISGKFDVITANPPYIPAAVIPNLAPEVRAEPRLALDGGEDGLDLIRRIIADGCRHLSDGGALFIEAAPDKMEAIAALFAENAYTGCRTVNDLAGLARVIMAVCL